MKLIWTPSISVGNEAIDKQHRDLFDRANSILEAMVQGKGKEEIANTIAFIETYVMRHFQDEERFLTSIKYPAIQEHLKHHRTFTADFADIKQKFTSDGPNASIAISLNRLISEWLRNHISNTDQDYAKFVKAA